MFQNTRLIVNFLLKFYPYEPSSQMANLFLLNVQTNNIESCEYIPQLVSLSNNYIDFCETQLLKWDIQAHNKSLNDDVIRASINEAKEYRGKCLEKLSSIKQKNVQNGYGKTSKKKQ